MDQKCRSSLPDMQIDRQSADNSVFSKTENLLKRGVSDSECNTLKK